MKNVDFRVWIEPDYQKTWMNRNTIQRFRSYRFVSCYTCAKAILDLSPVMFMLVPHGQEHAVQQTKPKGLSANRVILANHRTSMCSVLVYKFCTLLHGHTADVWGDDNSVLSTADAYPSITIPWSSATSTHHPHSGKCRHPRAIRCLWAPRGPALWWPLAAAPLRQVPCLKCGVKHRENHKKLSWASFWEGCVAPYSTYYTYIYI